MATRSPESAKGKAGNVHAHVLGRSAATGRYVLKPASKAGKLSMRDAKLAVRRVLEKKN